MSHAPSYGPDDAPNDHAESNDVSGAHHDATVARPNVAALASWLLSWVQPDGAIHGFHSHAVWGTTPADYHDTFCGHSTFASPLLPALAEALRQQDDEQGRATLERLVRFQVSSTQPHGEFDHIGFQCGATVATGLIHNVVPYAMLCETIAKVGDRLPGELTAQVRQVLSKVDDACSRKYGERPQRVFTTNQSYAHAWARLQYMTAFDEPTWDDTLPADLNTMIRATHVRGLPDADSAGALRSPADESLVEPAEYYGLLIHPLLKAAERYGEPRFLEEAVALCRHVVRSAWTDDRGCRRFHRYWRRLPSVGWVRVREPMLIAGMGLTLSGIHLTAEQTGDLELQRFVRHAHRTYMAYQHPAGFFISATGWANEMDVIPASTWHSHDLYYLVHAMGAGPDFWQATWAPTQDLPAIVLGRSAYWIERGPQWAVRRYFTAGGPGWIGRKDRDHFSLDVPKWIDGLPQPPDDYRMSSEPDFARLDDAVVQVGGDALKSAQVVCCGTHLTSPAAGQGLRTRALPNCKNRIGSTNSVSSVDVRTPPITTVAKGR